MLWVYYHYKYGNSFSAEVVLRRQNLTSLRLMTVPDLKKIKLKTKLYFPNQHINEFIIFKDFSVYRVYFTDVVGNSHQMIVNTISPNDFNRNSSNYGDEGSPRNIQPVTFMSISICFTASFRDTVLYMFFPRTARTRTFLGI